MDPIRLLLVDDNPDLRFLVRAATETRGGFEIVGEAGDGATAIELARSARPDLVLLDLDMPRMGGLDALPMLRTEVPEAQVVVFSSSRREEYESLVRAGGAVGYMEKGITARQLVDELLALAGVLELVDGALASVTRGLPADTASAGEARRFVDQVLDRWDCAPLLDDVQLLVSELVTNAVVHARSDAQVAVRFLPEALRIEVLDRGTGDRPSTARPEVEPRAESGRGLLLVETLASSWGIDEVSGGTSVWFEVARPDSPIVG